MFKTLEDLFQILWTCISGADRANDIATKLAKKSELGAVNG